jgi:hypothetical protein
VCDERRAGRATSIGPWRRRLPTTKGLDDAAVANPAAVAETLGVPCLLVLLLLGFPRLALFFMWATSDYLGRAYHGNLVPFLGFLFMPLTTMAYAWAINSNGSVSGGYLVAVVVAVLADLGVIGGGAANRRR